MEEREDNTIYKVVMNHEEQYSIWPAERENRARLEGCGQSRSQGGLPGLYQRSLDRHATAKFEKENGGGNEEDVAASGHPHSTIKLNDCITSSLK